MDEGVHAGVGWMCHGRSLQPTRGMGAQRHSRSPTRAVSLEMVEETRSRKHTDWGQVDVTRTRDLDRVMDGGNMEPPSDKGGDQICVWAPAEWVKDALVTVSG